MSAMDLNRRVTMMLRLGSSISIPVEQRRSWMNTCCMLILLCSAMLLDPSGPRFFQSSIAQDVLSKVAETDQASDAQVPQAVPADEKPAASVPQQASSNISVAEDRPTSQEAPADIVIKGRVVDARGRPIPRSLAIVSGYGEGGPFAQRYEFTSAEYEIALPRFPDERVTLRSLWFAAPGHGLRTLTLPRLEDADAESIQRAGLTENLSLSDLTVPLPELDRTTIRVLTPTGSPCSKAIVQAYYINVPNGFLMADEPTGLMDFLPEELNAIVGCETDANGEGSVKGIPNPLLGAVSVETSEYGKQIFRFSNVQGAVPRELKLLPVGIARGKVAIDDPSTIAGTKLHLSTGMGEMTSAEAVATIGENGEWEALIAEGQLRIMVDWNKELQFLPRIAANQNMTVRAGETNHIPITTEPAVLIRGRVLSSDAETPVEGARISIRNPRNGIDVSNYVLSDSSGYYESRVLPGELRQQLFEYRKSTLRMRYQYPEIAACEVPSVSDRHELAPIYVEQRPTVKGELLDESGKPLADRVIAVRDADGFQHTLGVVKSDSRGRFDITLAFASNNVEWSIVENPRQGTVPARRIPLRVIKADTQDMVLQASK